MGALRAGLQVGVLQQPSGQTIDGSLKFTEGPSDNNGTTLINRDFANEGNRKVFTFSCWFKGGKISGTRDNQYLFSTEYEQDSNTRGFALFWNRSTGKIAAYDYAASPTVWTPTSSDRNCRDTGWFHIVFAIDTTATDGNRIKLYINGERDTGMGEPTRNVELNVNRTEFEHYIGSHNYQGNQIRYVDGQLSQVYFIDGQALDASHFGATDPLTNTWIPKEYTRGVFEELDKFNTYTWGEPQNSLRYQGIKFPSSAGGTVAWKAMDASVSGLNLYTSTDNSSWTRRLSNQTVDSTNGLVYESSDQYVILVNDTDTNWGDNQIQMFSDVNGATIHYSNATYPGNGNPTMTWNGPTYTDGTIASYNSLYFPFDGNTPITQDKSGNGNDWTAEGFGGSVALDNPNVSGATPILNTTQGGKIAAVGVFAHEENIVYTLTGSSGSGSGYVFENEGTKPTLSMIRGATYTFDYSAASSHPFRFATAADAAGSTEYTTGTSISGNVIKFTVPHNAPDTLYYYCTNHGGMGNSISVTTDNTKADQYAANCVLALPLSNGDQVDIVEQINCTKSAKTITVTNAVSNSVYGNFYGGSTYFDGSGDYINAASDSDFTFGTGDFTIEGWVYPLSNGANKTVFSTNWGASGSLIITFSHPQTASADGKFALFDHTQNNGQPTVATTNTYGLNKWHHVAFVRNGNSHKFYINGIEDGSATYTASNLTRDVFVVGAVYTNGTETFDGYIQDVRIYKGVAKYTSNFIIPSSDPDIVPDTPSGGVSGGSKLTKITEGAVNFGNAASYMSFPNTTDVNFGDGAFTWECFAYFTSVSGSVTVMGQWENSPNRRSWLIQVNDGKLQSYVSNSGNSGGDSRNADSPANYMAANRWYHIAVTRSGNDMRLFIDGKLITTTDLGTFTVYANTDDEWQIGAQNTSGSHKMKGLLSNVRIVKGTALYTSSFTPPTEPLTNVTNTKLLCCQSNTSRETGTVVPFKVTNNSGTAGAYAPSGLTGGIDFPGGQGTSEHSNGSYLQTASTSFAGNYTIEFWFNVDELPSDGSGYGSVFWDGRPTNTNADNVFGSIYAYNTTGATNDFTVRYHGNGVDRITGTTNLSVGTWYHLALVRNNGAVRLYINGTAEGDEYIHSTSMISSADRPYVGGWGFGSSSVPGHDQYATNGKMSNLRMTSTAVYTSNFTPPTSNLTAITGTTFLGLQSTSSATDYTSVLAVTGVIGAAEATNLTPFNTDINTVRGQETGYSTLNPLDNTGITKLTNGNLDFRRSVNDGRINSTIAASSGKWYAECQVGNDTLVGISEVSSKTNTYPGGNAGSYGYFSSAFYDAGSSSSYGNSFSTDDYIGVILDLDNGTLEFTKNGLSQGVAKTGLPAGSYRFSSRGGRHDGTETFDRWNFGQKPFKFPPPDGFQPLNAANVRPETVIVRPDQYVGVTTYKGNGGTQSLDLGMSPDFAWVKRRDDTFDHMLFDTVRGDGKELYSNRNYAEGSPGTSKLDFIADGFDLPSTGVNVNGASYVAWFWKAGGKKGTFNVDDVGYANASDVNMNVGALNSVAYNTADTWSDDLSSPQGGYVGSVVTNAFNGNLSNGFEAGNPSGGYSTIRFEPATPITVNTKIRIYVFDLNDSDVSYQYRVNDGSFTTMPGTSSPYLRWQDLGFTGTLRSFEYRSNTSLTYKPTLYAIEIDGRMLVDSGTDLTASGIDQYPSIPTSACSVGTKQGFSIITYTGDNTSNNGRVPHGLSQDPDFMIFKSRNASDNWAVYWSVLGQKYMELQSNGYSNAGNPQNRWSSLPSNGVVYLGSDTNINTKNHIIYAWHDVPGLQKFGSYSTNGDGSGGGSEDGTFVYLGFRPALILFKGSSYTSDWTWIDEERCKINYNDVALRANYQYSELGNSRGGVGSSSQPENYAVDFLSNGFKVRASAGSLNYLTTNTVCYAAWAKQPQFNLYGRESNAR